MTTTEAAPGQVGIRIVELSKSYGTFRALASVSLDISPGEFVTLLGPSGSGKTTLLMIVAGFVRADAGSLLFGGRETITVPPHERGVGMVFQNYALFPHMTVEQNVGYPLRVRKVAPAQIARRVADALDLVQLGGLGNRKPAELSGGQRQRVALARAVVFEPRILLMDEPLSALDKNLRESMQLEIRRLHERLGVTTLYVTHDQREALTMSDRVVVMRDGRVIQEGTPASIYEQPRTSFVGKFVGESYLLPIETASGTIQVLGRPLLAAQSTRIDGAKRCSVLIRPERLRICAPGVDATRNVFEGTYRGSVYQGDSVLVQMDLVGGGEIAMRCGATDASLRNLPAIGAPFAMALAPEDTIIVLDDA